MIFGNLISGAQLDQADERRGPKIRLASEPDLEQHQQALSQKKQDWQFGCKYTLSEVQQHCSLDDCWMVIFDKVYDITEFVYEHPGGDFILLEYAGRDATHPFLSSRHGSSAYKMMDKYWIGILVDEELYYSNNSSYCSVYSNLSWRSTPTLEDQSSTASSQLTSASADNTTTTTSTTSATTSDTATSSEVSSSNTDIDDEDEPQASILCAAPALLDQIAPLPGEAVAVADQVSMIMEKPVERFEKHPHHLHQYTSQLQHSRNLLQQQQQPQHNRHHLSQSHTSPRLDQLTSDKRHHHSQYHSRPADSTSDQVDQLEEQTGELVAQQKLTGKRSPVVYETLHYFYRALTQR